MGPSAQYVSWLKGGRPGTRPNGGLNPTMPEKEDGMRMEPPMSDPVARMDSPAASAAPEPPEEPPGVSSVFQGLRVTPHSLECVYGAQQNSGVVVRPWTTAPALKILSTIGWLTSAMVPFSVSEPSSARRPAIGCSSLSSSGMPSSAPSCVPPAAKRSCEVRAAA